MHPEWLADESHSRLLTVFYHGGCPDGITGAWAVYLALSADVRARLAVLGGLFANAEGRGDPQKQLVAVGTVFHGISPEDPCPPLALALGRHVVYVDVVPPLGVALAIAEAAATLTTLDHHRSSRGTVGALSALRGVASVYDEARSGAQIAWDWAHRGAARPAVVDYVADRDLWAWELADSRAINKALHVDGLTQGFAPLTKMLAGLPGGLAARGRCYLEYEQKVLAGIMAGAYRATVSALLPGEREPREYCVLAVNSPALQSELGEALMAKAGPEVHFVAIWRLGRGPQDGIRVSVRTTRPDVDLSAIAPNVVGAKPGGGGHPRAASFAIEGDSAGRAVRRDAR